MSLVHRKNFISLFSLLTCSSLVLLLFVCDGFQPFGLRSLITADANFQYLDFYAYYKEVLSGNNSFLYSFSKTLGGNCISVFSYYLASPFTILYALFPQSSYYAVFNIIYLLKVSLAAFTMSLFLQYRFPNDKKGIYAVLLSLSYALSQYTIAQSSNSMWLDGVYMLPVLMMQITRFVRRKSATGIPVAVGLSILFNWYSAGMNCFFAFIWYIHEYIEFNTKRDVQSILKDLTEFCGLMLLGVGLSAVLFLPTILAFGSGNRGGLQFSLLIEPDFYGNILSGLKNYFYGTVSSIGSPVLYCGLIPLVACISHLVSKNVHKGGSIFLLVFMILMLHWNPLMMTFSLIKSVTSYWYRYGYICIFIILFTAGKYCYADEEADWKIPLLGGVLLALIYPFCWINHISDHLGLIFRNMGTFLLGGVLLSMYVKYSGKRHAGTVLLLLCSADLLYNVHILAAETYSTTDNSYGQYAAEAQKGISAVQSSDTGNYRISETSTRLMYDDGMTSAYNDAMAYSYRSISGYTSSPDDNQRNFLANLGYRKNGENYNITNTSIIGADSLLGVKYVFSPYDIKGLERVSDDTYNGKYIYRNPYVLPMSFVYTDHFLAPDDADPFVYQNDLYKQLTGRSENIYEPVTYSYTHSGDTITISLQIPDGNFALYGNLPSKNRSRVTLDVNDAYSMGYVGWGSQSVFYIPYERNTAEVSLTAEDIDPENYTMQFYVLDLDLLEEYSSQLRAHVPDSERIENGRVSITVNDGREGEKLFLSVPFDQGWEVTVNGQPAEYQLIGDCMYSISLSEGKNDINMKYHVPGLITGMIITVCSLFILVYLCIRMK